MATSHQRIATAGCVMLRGFHIQRNFNISQELEAAGGTSAAFSAADVETRCGICSDGRSPAVGVTKWP